MPGKKSGIERERGRRGEWVNPNENGEYKEMRGVGCPPKGV